MTNRKNRFEMGRVLRIAGIVLSIAAVLLLTGCPQEEDDQGVSMQGRLTQLQSDLNNDYSRVYLNWAVGTNTRELGANEAWVTTAFGATSERQFSFEGAQYNESTGVVTAKLNSTAEHTNRDVTITMQKSGKDWFIAKFEWTGRTTLQSID